MSDLISESHYELIAGYALGTLTASERLTTEALLAADPALQAALAHYQAVMGLMAEATAPVKAPADLRSRIMQAVEQQLPLAPHPFDHPIATVTQLPRRSRNWYRFAAGAAALLTLALGLDNYRLRQQVGQVQAAIQQLEAAKESEEEHEYYAFRLKAQVEDSPAMGLVAVNLNQGNMEIALDGMPALNPDEAYHLWAFTKDKQKVLCGRFTPSPTGSINETIAVRPEDYPSDIEFMRVSREPAATPSDPSQRVLVLSSES